MSLNGSKPNNSIESFWLSFLLTYYSNKHDFPNTFTSL